MILRGHQVALALPATEAEVRWAVLFAGPGARVDVGASDASAVLITRVAGDRRSTRYLDRVVMEGVLCE